MRNKILTGFAALVVIFGGLYYWFALESGMPEGEPYLLDAAVLKELADSIPGNRVSAIHVEHVTGFSFPGAAVVSGGSWAGREMAVYAYQLRMPGGDIIVDTALTKEGAEAFGAVMFDEAGFERVKTAMLAAQHIVITHEHADHIGGLFSLAKTVPAIRARAKLTAEQLSDPAYMQPLLLQEEERAAYETLAYEKYHALAPGVVLIKAPGHTPGTQMIYVETADGSRYLFLGDIAWHYESVETLRPRPRFISQGVLNEDREAVQKQLAGIKAFVENNPQVHILSGHDGEQVRSLIENGALNAGFQPQG